MRVTSNTIQQLEAGLGATAKETATFGMGCFWGPDAMFGALPGVIRTRVGYAGGTTINPSYRRMGDHTETVEIDFDPTMLAYEDVLRYFWANHYANRDEYKGRQYLSLLRYRTDAQAETIQRVKAEVETELGEEIGTDIAPFKNFTLAEERHQKYYLKRYPKALSQLADLYVGPEDMTDSTFAARLNGFVKGFGTKAGLLDEISSWPVSEEAKAVLQDCLQNMKW